MAMNGQKIAVLGGGTWGVTLASHLARQGHDVHIWEFAPAVVSQLQTARSLRTLPQLKLPDAVRVTNDMAEALRGRSLILSVTPSHTVRGTFDKAHSLGALEAGAMVISATKGLENDTLLTMSGVIRERFPEVGEIVILSGPSHAEEVALGRPVALVAASTSQPARERVRDLFSSDTFRAYTGDDPMGAELGGTIKNIYAIACGIIDGLGLGDNTKAAVMTRGLMEMTRLGAAVGARPLTFFGLSGLGDMIVTCGSQHSRNRLLGEKIGQGKRLDQALKEMTMVAEGVNATTSTHRLARMKGVEMPIVNEVHAILFDNKPPQRSIRDLMAREVGAEMEGIAL